MPETVKRYEAVRRPGADKRFLHGLITHYPERAAFKAGAPRTRYDRRKLLDRVRGEIGKMELRALDAKGARAALTDHVWSIRGLVEAALYGTVVHYSAVA